MVWHTLPIRAHSAPERDVNYRLLEFRESLNCPLARHLDALVGPYAEFFTYGVRAGGDKFGLIEGLLRLEAIGAVLDAKVPPLWLELARTGLTVAEDANMQRADRLFGIDGNAGLLGELKCYRQMAANELPVVSSAEQREFLHVLLAFVDRLLPCGEAIDLWSWRLPDGEVQPSAALTLPVYLQALALLALVREWIGGHPGLGEQAACSRPRAFLMGDGSTAEFLPGTSQSMSVSAAVRAAAQALAV